MASYMKKGIQLFLIFLAVFFFGSGCSSPDPNLILLDASAKGDISKIKKSLSKGADINVNINGLSPIFMAVASVHEGKSSKELIEFLLNQGADINSKDLIGSTPLGYVTSLNNLDLADFLISHGADMDNQNNTGLGILHSAIASKNKELFDLMLERGADTNIQLKNGWTPLHLLAVRAHENEDFIKELLEHGASITILDKEGKTPIDIALRNEQEDILDSLKRDY